MKRKTFAERLLLVRSYRGDTAIGRTSMHIADFDDAVKAWRVYTQPHMRTEYCALFSPVDKRGVRRQLKHYVYSAMLPVHDAAVQRAMRRRGYALS